MYYDRRQQRLNSFDEGTGDEFRQTIKSPSSPRKKFPKERPRKRARHDMVRKQLDETRMATFSETSISSIAKDKQLAANSGEKGNPLQEICKDDDHLETVDVFGPNEGGEACCSIPSSPMKQSRKRRFIWTEETDR